MQPRSILAAILPAMGLLAMGADAADQSVPPAPPAPSVPQLVGAYAAAWGSRDAARIAALHTVDTVFDLRVDGELPAIGREAAQQRFAGILRDNPGYSSTVRKVDFGPDFVVIEYLVAMDPQAPFRLGRIRYVPTGRSYALPAIDVIRFRHGLVFEKVTFLDTETIRRNSREAAIVGEAR